MEKLTNYTINYPKGDEDYDNDESDTITPIPEAQQEFDDRIFNYQPEEIDKNAKETENQKKQYFDMNHWCIFQMFFSHLLQIMLKVSRTRREKGQFSANDIPQFRPEEQIDKNAKGIHDEIVAIISKDKEISRSKMFIIIFGKNKGGLLAYTGLVCLNFAGFFGISIMIQKLVEEITLHQNSDLSYKYAGILSAIALINTLFVHNAYVIIQNAGAKLRLSIVSALFRQIISISSYKIKQANIGQVMNLISNDLNILQFNIFFFFVVLISPLIILAAILVLVDRHGPIGVIFLVILFLIVPLQTLTGKLSSTAVAQKNKLTDQRIKLTSQVIEGIQLIKMYTWEDVFRSKIEDLRSQQSQFIFKNLVWKEVSKSFSFCSNIFAMIVSILIIHYLDNSEKKLTPAKIFSTMQLLTIMRVNFIAFLSMGISFIFDLRIFLGRLRDLFLIDSDKKVNLNAESETKVLELENFSSYWNKQGQPVIQNINFKLLPGTINLLIGKVGSGQSSLLLSILQETPKLIGSWKIPSQIAYVEQEPYVFSGLFYQNIILGYKYDEAQFKKIIRACNLLPDIQQMPNGVQTEIGEKGLNLSGGQKARVSLARALYSDADLYLLDDPLSAVDAKNSLYLFNNAIQQLLKEQGKIVIIATHQLSKCQHADQIFIMENGTITKSGGFQDLKDQISIMAGQIHTGTENSSATNQQNDQTKNEKQKAPENADQQPAAQSALFTKEEDQNSDVNTTTYQKYLSFTSGLGSIISIAFLFIVSQLIYTSFSKGLANYNGVGVDNDELFIVLGSLSLFALIVYLIKYTFLDSQIVIANSQIHNEMMEKLCRAKPVYFDQTSSGRIINKFSNDLGLLDNMLNTSASDGFQGILNFLNIVITVAIFQPYIFIMLVILIPILVKWFNFCKPIILMTKQLDLMSKSPVFSFFSMTLSGIIPIRIYNQADMMQRKMDDLANKAAQMNFGFWGLSRVFGGYTHMFTVIFGCSGIFLLIKFNSDNPGTFAQSLMFLLLISDFFQWAMRQLVSLDSYLSSAQRCFNTIQISQEADYLKKGDDDGFKQDWPNDGAITFDNVVMKYRENIDPVLRGVSFKILPGQKVGCVGRTGAGQSSVLVSLFRMCEIEKNQGSVMIDSVDTASLGLQKLRDKISIIPQIPFVFTGTVRRNLDPLEIYTDNELLDVLNEINLLSKVKSLEHGLFTDMSDVSSVFSVGEKQLICLARTILKQNKILVLDEATANIDMQTDELIQSQIKEKFDKCTILTIAHRLNTIADYDQVIVLDRGVVAEFSTPFELLVNDPEKDLTINKNSYFANLVKHTGDRNAQSIFSIAKKHYFENITQKQQILQKQN